MNCLKCDKETANPKFCSTSCSVGYNNKLNPKRKATEKFCKRCNTSLGFVLCSSPGSRKCDDCKGAPRVDWSQQTKGKLRGAGNAILGGRYPYIRTHARRSYKKSGQPMSCSVCNYSLHVDICHIVDVKAFSEDISIAYINKIDNLVALCKNHHWEFDNGHLTL